LNSFAWVDSGAFIMYVPYGKAIKDANGNVPSGGIDQDYCQNNLNDKGAIGTLTVCDAPGGMTRIFNTGAVDG